MRTSQNAQKAKFAEFFFPDLDKCCIAPSRSDEGGVSVVCYSGTGIRPAGRSVP